MVTKVAKTIRHLTADELQAYFSFRRIGLGNAMTWRQPESMLRHQIIKELPAKQQKTICWISNGLTSLPIMPGF